MSKRGLGKGLDALLSTSSLAREKQHIASHSQALSADGELTDLAIGQLQPGVYTNRVRIWHQKLLKSWLPRSNHKVLFSRSLFVKSQAVNLR